MIDSAMPCNLSDPALEDSLIDLWNFPRFLGIIFETEIPDFTTLWRFRKRLNKAGFLDKLFASKTKRLINARAVFVMQWNDRSPGSNE